MTKKKKVKINSKGYLEKEPEHSNLIHREIALRIVSDLFPY